MLSPTRVRRWRSAPFETRRRWTNQRRRRANILRCARELVAESGLDNVQITAVAHRSGVSVQTIYNVVGPRHELLGAAAEWVLALTGRAEGMAAEADINTLFASVELFWAAAILRRDYTEKLIRAQSQCNLLEQPFVDVTQRVLLDQLVRLSREAPWCAGPIFPSWPSIWPSAAMAPCGAG